jgi:hypothetical protein
MQSYRYIENADVLSNRRFIAQMLTANRSPDGSTNPDVEWTQICIDLIRKSSLDNVHFPVYLYLKANQGSNFMARSSIKRYLNYAMML